MEPIFDENENEPTHEYESDQLCVPDDGREETGESSVEDVSLCRVVKSTRSKTPVIQAKKKTMTGYLVTPSKTRKEKPVSRKPSTPSSSLTPLNHPINQSHLNDEANRVFFTSLVSLLKYLDVESKEIDLARFNKRILLFSFYGIYPKVEWLSLLVGSEKMADVRVSGQAMEVDCD
jgi:hypothetical protein